eukprot:130043_1
MDELTLLKLKFWGFFTCFTILMVGLASVVCIPLLTSSSKFGNGNDPMVCPPPGFGDIFQRWLLSNFMETWLFPFAHRCFNHNAADVNSPFNGLKEATCSVSCAKGSTFSVFREGSNTGTDQILNLPIDMRCVYDPTNPNVGPYWVIHDMPSMRDYLSGISPSSQVFPRDFHSGANGDANSLFCVDDDTGDPVANDMCELASLKSSMSDWESVSPKTPEFTVHGQAVAVECADGSHVANDAGVRAYQMQCDQGEWRVPNGAVHSKCVLSDAGKKKFQALGSGSSSSKPGVLTFLAMMFGPFLLALAL